jgi:hypothetical protein
MSSSHMGKKHSDEAKAKIAAANSKPCPPETKEKISASNKGRKLSPERVERMREVALLVHARKRAESCLQIGL